MKELWERALENRIGAGSTVIKLLKNKSSDTLYCSAKTFSGARCQMPISGILHGPDGRPVCYRHWKQELSNSKVSK